jgi:hypothetical protein
MDHFLLEPDTDLQCVSGQIGDQVELYILTVRNIRHIDLVVKE